jgi:hypothetical protein
VSLEGRVKRLEKKFRPSIQDRREIPPSEQIHVFYSDSKSPEEIDNAIETKKRELTEKYGHFRGAKFFLVKFVNRLENKAI